MPSGIRANLYLIVLGATLPLVALFVSLVWRDARHEASLIRQSALDQAHVLSHELETIAWQLEMLLHTVEQLVEFGDSDQAALAAYLEQHSDGRMPPVHRVALFDRNGEELLSVDGKGEPAAAIDHPQEADLRRQAMAKALQSEEASIHGPFLQGTEGRPVIIIARGSNDSGVVGGIAASLPVDHLREILLLPGLPEGAVITIATSKGTILARSHDHDVWLGNDLSALGFLEDALKSGRGTQVATSIDGIERLVAFIQTRRLGLIAHVDLPTSAAYAPLYGHVTAVVVTAAMIVLMVILVGWWLASRIHRPLQQIGAGVAAFTAGDLDRRIDVEGPREIAQLATEMNRMAGALKEREFDLLESRAALQRSEQMLESIIDSEPACVKILDRQAQIVRINAAGRETLAADEERLAGIGMSELLLADEQEAFDRHFAKVLAGEPDRIEFRIRDLGGQIHTMESFAAPIRLATTSGMETCYLAVSRDVTTDRESEERLRQSQRLTSIGKLTGGIAHDFNNLLTVIIGSIELLQERLNDRLDVQRPLADALASANRGAELTNRLLAFARRQPLQPRRLDLNVMVDGMTELLRRTLGEPIEVRTVPAADLWTTVADPSQLESVLLNLALNARDAMPDGGRLLIETSNVSIDAKDIIGAGDLTSGDYVQLAVTDDGAGMTPKVLERVFEPFFSTKDPGKGNGLGLSMAHGFAKQSGGHIRVYSELGEGTTVRLLLPRAGAAPERIGPSFNSSASVPGEGERILLVEDDPAVRELSASSLRHLGYDVTIACQASEALDILEGPDPVDLLFTDVVLPGGVDGVQLAERAAKVRPGLKVLFTSGYSENALINNGRLAAGIQLITKPYRRDELSRRLRDALGRPAYTPIAV